MTHITRRLTAKNRDQLRDPKLGNRVRATFLYKVSQPPLVAQAYAQFTPLDPDAIKLSSFVASVGVNRVGNNLQESTEKSEQ